MLYGVVRPSDDLVLPELQLAGADPYDRPTAGRQELQPDDVVLIGDRDLSDGPGESAAHEKQAQPGLLGRFCSRIDEGECRP